VQSGRPLGQMQGTKEAERVPRSGALAVVASLLGGRLSGHGQRRHKEWRLVKGQERGTEAVTQEPLRRSELRGQRKLQRLKDAA
jgi:hypothetical protein